MLEPPGGVLDPPGSDGGAPVPFGSPGVGHGVEPGAPALGSLPAPGPAPALGSLEPGAPELGAPALGSLNPPLPGAPLLGAPLLGAPALGSLNPPLLGAPLLGAPLLGAPLLGAPALGLLVPVEPEPLPPLPEPFLAAAFTAIGETIGSGAPAVEDGGADDGAPKPEDGAVVVVVESPGQGLDPELPPVEHGCGGAVVVVVEEPLPFLALGHFGPVVDVVDPFLPEPDLPFFFAAVVTAGPDGDAEAAAR